MYIFSQNNKLFTHKKYNRIKKIINLSEKGNFKLIKLISSTYATKKTNKIAIKN